MAFIEFDHYLNIVSHDIFNDVVPRSQIYGGSRHLWMDSAHDKSASNLIGQ